MNPTQIMEKIKNGEDELALAEQCIMEARSLVARLETERNFNAWVLMASRASELLHKGQMHRDNAFAILNEIKSVLATRVPIHKDNPYE